MHAQKVLPLDYKARIVTRLLCISKFSIGHLIHPTNSNSLIALFRMQIFSKKFLRFSWSFFFNHVFASRTSNYYSTFFFTKTSESSNPNQRRRAFGQLSIQRLRNARFRSPDSLQLPNVSLNMCTCICGS